MLSSVAQSSIPLLRGGPRRCVRRRRRLLAVAAAAKKDASKPGSARLARILRQYDDATLAEQQAALEEYQRKRNHLRGSDDPGSSRKLRNSAGSAYVSQADADMRALVFRWDPRRGIQVPVRGGLGRGQVCWWALWVKVNREKQVAETLVRLAADLGPLRDPETGEPTGEARVVETWAPVKKVKAWNPKTGKVGHKTLRYQDGGIMFLRCLLDEEMELLLQGNINVLGFKSMEILDAGGGNEEKFPKPCTEEEIREAQEWELDLTPLDEAAVRKMLGLPDKALSDTLRAADQEEEEEATREFNRREQIIKQRDWYDGSGKEQRGGSGGWYDPATAAGAGAGRAQAQQRGRRGQEVGGPAGSDGEEQAWEQSWDDGVELNSPAAGTAGLGALGAALEGWGNGGAAVADDGAPASDGQLRALERLGHEGPAPATRGEASALISQLKEAQRAGLAREPPSEGQLEYLADLGHTGPAPESRSAASALIEELKAARRGEQGGAPDPLGPPSEGQLRFLGQLGYEGPQPSSRAEAGELIDDLKAQQGSGGRARDGKLDPSGPPSKGQLDLLDMLSYAGKSPATRGEADKLIDEIKASRPRRSDASDEKQPPSEGQLRYLGILGHQGLPPANRAEARELIDSIKREAAARGPGSFATMPPDPDAPPSEGQRRYLTLLGYEGEAPTTRGEADELIDRLKVEAQAAGAGGAFDPGRPASEGQLRYLTILGHEPEGELTRGEADVLIERLKRQRLEPATQGQLRFLSQLGYRGRPPASRSQADEIIDGLKARRSQGAAPGPEAAPSEAQLTLLSALGHAGKAPATRGQASALIDELKAVQQSQRAQRGAFGGGGGYDSPTGDWGEQQQRGTAGGGYGSFGSGYDSLGSGRGGRGTGPATEGQLRFLGQLGYQGPEPSSWAEAGELIDELKAQQKASGGYSSGSEGGSGRPTDGQLRFLTQLNYEGPEPATRAEAGELIANLKAQKQAQQADPLAPPSEGQLRFLGQLGYEGPPPATRAEVGELIASLKAKQREDKWQGRGSARSSSGGGGWFSGGSSDEEFDDALSYFGIVEPATADPYAAGGAAAGAGGARGRAGAATGGGLLGSAPGLSGFDWATGSSSGDEREGGEDLWGGWQEAAAPQQPAPAAERPGAASAGRGPADREGRSRWGEPLDPLAPPSNGQLRYLGILGHQGSPPATRGEADAIIDSLKAQGAGRDRQPRAGRGEREGRGGRRERDRDWDRGSSSGSSSGGWYSGKGGSEGGWDAAAGGAAEADLSWWDEPAGASRERWPAEADQAAATASGTEPLRSPYSSSTSGSSRSAGVGEGGGALSSFPLWDLPADVDEAGAEPEGGLAPGRRSVRREGSRRSSSSDQQAEEGEGEAAAAPATGLAPGAAVEVVGGSFADFQGTVLAVEGQSITAELDIFGRPTQVELDPRDVQPL